MQVRRQARGAGAIGPVALAGVVRQRVVEELREPLVGACLARRPCLLHAGVPADPGQQSEVLDRHRCQAGDSGYAQRRRQDGTRIEPAAGHAPERGEDAIGPAGAGLQFPGLEQQRRLVAVALEAGGAQRLLERGVARRHRRFVQAVPGDARRAGFGCQRQQRGRGRAPAHHQARATPAQVPVQRAQRVVQPPVARGPWLPGTLLLRRMHVGADHRSTVRERRRERGVVAQPQVAAEPDDRCRHRLSPDPGRNRARRR